MSPTEPQWARADEQYELPPNEVHVWRATIHEPEECISRMFGILSLDERNRAERFHFEADRKRSIIGRGMLRLILAHCLRQSADQLRFEDGPFGKPRLVCAEHDAIEFNISHSGDFVLLALNRGRAVRVD